jgi:hypothetical protein
VTESKPRLERELTKLLATDYLAYGTADDEQRHFDPLSAAQAYAIYLAVTFVYAIAKRLKTRLPRIARAVGTKVADKIADAIEQSAGLRARRDSRHSTKSDSVDALRVEQLLRTLLRERNSGFKETELLGLGRKAIEIELKQLGFPSSVAGAKAQDFESILSARTKDEDALDVK